MPSWGSLLKELEGLVSVGEEPWKFVPLVLLVVVVTSFQLVLSKQERGSRIIGPPEKVGSNGDGEFSSVQKKVQKNVQQSNLGRRHFIAGLPGDSFGLAQAQGELRFCLRSEPKTFDPLKVEDDASVAIRYLTGGVLVRLNRQTQALEPELAKSWTVSKDGRQITFTLRSGVSFSDGTPFSAEDVAYTVQQLMDPALHSPTGDAFRSGPGNVETKIISPTQISITFPAPVAGLDRQFDQVAILSAHSRQEKKWQSWARSSSPTTSPAPPCN